MRVTVRLGPNPAGGILPMVGYSFVGHIVALILIVLAPRFIPHRPPPPLVMTAQIVSLPQAGPAAPAQPAAPAKPRVSPTEMAKKAAEEAAKARKPEPPPPEPSKPKPPKPKPDKNPPPAAVVSGKDEGKDEKETKKPAAPESREVHPAGPVTQGVGLSAPGGDDASGIPSITSESFPYSYYRTAMVNRIRAYWRRPLTPGLRESLRCAVSFVIDKSGQVSGAEISVPSGFGPLDDSALQAVLDANRLPPLPYQYTTPSVRAELIFELTPD